MFRSRICPGRLACGAFVLTFALLAAALAGDSNRQRSGPLAEEVEQSRPAWPMAGNPQVLFLYPGREAVLGWVGGTKSHAGDSVTIEFAGRATEVTVGNDNTFTWPRPKEPAAGEVTARLPISGGTTLRSSIQLLETSIDSQSVFFVTDRSTFRPGHTIRFAAYVRQRASDGKFVPVANAELVVDLTADYRQLRTARLTLRTDAAGKAEGAYTFTDADPIGGYTLSASACVGSARVHLTEYRKSETTLTVRGELRDRTLVVRMEARDYLGRLVPGVRGSYTAEVRQPPASTATSLDLDAHAQGSVRIPTPEEIDRLPSDERLLALVGGVPRGGFSTHESCTVSRHSGTTVIGVDGTATAEFDLRREWLNGRHEVILNGVMTDGSGREYRDRGHLQLPSAASSRGIGVSVSRELVAAGDRIGVTIAPLGLEPGEPHPAAVLTVARIEPAVESSDPTSSRVRRTAISTRAVKVGTHSLTPQTPGAYVLMAQARFADGTLVSSETGLVVRPVALVPSVELALDDTEIPTGGQLRGTVRTRSVGARVLVALHDVDGTRALAPVVTGDDGTARFELRMPLGVSYGCGVTAERPLRDGVTSVDHRGVFVLPTDRTVDVTVSAPETAAPGDEVTLSIETDRPGPTDLIVAVTDESVPMIDPEAVVDPRSFYFADGRGRHRTSCNALVRRLGHATVAQAAAKARRALADSRVRASEPGIVDALQTLVRHDNANGTWDADIAVLLRLAGFAVYQSRAPSKSLPGVRVTRATRLADAVQTWANVPSQGIGWVGGTVYLTADREAVWNDPWPAPPPNMFAHGTANLGALGVANNLGVGGGITGVTGGQLGIYGGYVPFGQYRSASSFVGGFGGGFGGAVATPPRPAPATIPPPSSQIEPPIQLGDDTLADSLGGFRRDFADTAFWSANVRADTRGRASIRFRLPDSLTSWRVTATVITPKTQVGRGTSIIRTSKPIMVWPEPPTVFTEGDILTIPVTVHNLGTTDLTIKVAMTAVGAHVESPRSKDVFVSPGESQRVNWTVRAERPGYAELRWTAIGLTGRDAIVRRVPIRRAAVDEMVFISGIAGRGDLRFDLPADVDPDSIRSSVTVTTSLAADTAAALPYLVEYPHGCVEQTMSRFLPAILSARVLKKSGIRLPELEARLPAVADAGIKRLLVLQRPDGGWGWQAGGNTHEMMTPYALLGLIEAEAAGYPCPNPGAITLGLARIRRFLEALAPGWDTGRRSQMNDSLFCLYVLARKETVPNEWWKRIEREIGTGRLSDYGLGLALETAVRSGRRSLANRIAGELAKRARRSEGEVYWTTAGFSRWADSPIEITAAVFRGLVAHDPTNPLIAGVLARFRATQHDGRWGSTKDTAMVLFAACDYLTAVPEFPDGSRGSVQISLNGRHAIEVPISDGKSGSTALSSDKIRAGGNSLTLQPVGQATAALVRATVRFTRRGPQISPRNHGVSVTRTLAVRMNDGGWAPLTAGGVVPRGAHIRVRVTARPNNNLGLSYTLVESPIPAGCESVPVGDPRFPPSSDLTATALREVRDGTVYFHYETAETVVAEMVFVAEMSGEVILPPARVERMYRPSEGGYSDSLLLRVVDR